MSTTALLFPGQGSQRVGMGAQLSREFEPARRVFQEADDTLGFALSRMCWEGPEAELTLTANTQPAILTNSIAVLRTLQAENDIAFAACAGHSLGEWSALVAAGALSFSDAIRLVRQRGQFMQDAVPAGAGAMAALIGLEGGAVAALCAEAAHGEVVSPANLNGGGQIVIAGTAGAVHRAVELAKQRGAKRAVLLQVSAPFHCALMKPAAERLGAALEPVEALDPKVPVIANVDATPYRPGMVKYLLVEQVTSPVRWEECVQRLVVDGVTRGLEVGTGAVLAGLVRRITPSIAVTTVAEPNDIRKLS